MANTPETDRTATTRDVAPTATGPIRRSIEVEYWVIDEQGYLTEPGRLVDASPGVEREFIVPLLEVKTTPCETMLQLRRDLLDRLREVIDRAEDRGKGLVPLATPIHRAEIEDRYSERTQIQDRVLGDDFEYVRHCAGTHIHVEQQQGREIDQLNTLIALDPALALINSSPYFRGERLTSGARSKLYRWLAYSSLPRQGQLWPYAGSRAAWARRIDRRYEEFVTEAVLCGFDREFVESQFTAEGAVWTPVQLRQEFSTVEWRSPDTALPSQVLQLADDVVGLVERATEREVSIEGGRGHVSEDAVVLPEFDAVQEYVETGIEEGLSTQVRSYLDRMGFDVSAYEPLTRELDHSEGISAAAARELRLEYADRLKRDIRRASSITAD